VSRRALRWSLPLVWMAACADPAVEGRPDRLCRGAEAIPPEAWCASGALILTSESEASTSSGCGSSRGETVATEIEVLLSESVQLEARDRIGWGSGDPVVVARRRGRSRVVELAVAATDPNDAVGLCDATTCHLPRTALARRHR